MYDNISLETRKRELMAEQLDQHKEQQNRASQLLKLAMLITFLLYLAFNVHLYLGDPLTWEHYFNDGYAAAGFLFMLGLAVLMAGFLSWVKHHAYLHFGLYGSVPLIVFTVIGFALFAEFFSSSATQDAKSNISLQNNQAYQQTLQTGSPATPAPVATINNGLADKIATAQQKLAQCEQRLKAGKEKHCEGSKGKLQALQDSQQASLQAQTTAAIAGAQAQAQADTERLKLNHDRQDKLKADSYNPVIVMVAQFMAVFSGEDYSQHIKTALVFVMLIVAVCFEILHHFLSDAKAQADHAVMGFDLEVAKLAGLPLSDSATYPQPTRQPFGFNQSATASSSVQPPLFKYQRDEPEPVKRSIGFAPWTNETVKHDPLVTARTGTPNPKLGTAEIQLELPKVSTWNRELSGYGIHSPDDKAMNQAADKASIQRIIERGLQSAKPCVPQSAKPCVSPAEKPCAQGLQKPLQNPVHRVTDVPPARRDSVGGNSLYRVWVAAVKEGVCRPSVEASRRWIQQRIAPTMTGSKTNDLKRIDAMCRAFFSRAMKEGLMRVNPDYRNGGKKYLWIGA